jgi:hypothetical protein
LPPSTLPDDVDRTDIEWPHALIQMGQVRFHKSHAMCSISIVCKFVIEDEVFVKKEKINIEDEFVFVKKEKTNIEDELFFEEDESDFVTKEKI